MVQKMRHPNKPYREIKICGEFTKKEIKESKEKLDSYFNGNLKRKDL